MFRRQARSPVTLLTMRNFFYKSQRKVMFFSWFQVINAFVVTSALSNARDLLSAVSLLLKGHVFFPFWVNDRYLLKSNDVITARK